MGSGDSINGWIRVLHNHAALLAAIIVVLAIVAYLKPKVVGKLVIAVVVIGAVIYVGSFLLNLMSTGIDEASKFMSAPKIKGH